jgi:CHAT domain-containing protein
MRETLIPLPVVEAEINVLSELFEGELARSLDANERFFKEKSASYGVIHLAMHGIVNPGMPILSSLAFSENKDSLEDNFLEAYEISQLKLNADLVVLSACETGYGEFQEGEGILSLARSFMYAGAPSLVVSLWQVNDASTAVIMKGFYTKIAEGMSKDKALQEAKMDYLESTVGVSGHPAFWSPFIQLGDSKAIELVPKSNKQLWIWILGGIATLLLGLFLRKKNK